MKKHLLWGALMASCVVRPAFASISADLTLVEKGGKLYANVLVSGIADCPVEGSVTITFTSPSKDFESSSFEAKWRSCSADPDDSDHDGKVGTAHTKAYRTVRSGKRVALGTWKVTVKAGDLVLATSEYKVE